jgi:hypothetical protein
MDRHLSAEKTGSQDSLPSILKNYFFINLRGIYT